MIGQISHEEFISRNENTGIQIRIQNGTLYAIIPYGKYTLNYWMQHSDYSWTNYDCKTK